MEEIIVKSLKHYREELLSISKALSKHHLTSANVHVQRELSKVKSAINKFNDPNIYINIKIQSELIK